MLRMEIRTDVQRVGPIAVKLLIQKLILGAAFTLAGFPLSDEPAHSQIAAEPGANKQESASLSETGDATRILARPTLLPGGKYKGKSTDKCKCHGPFHCITWQTSQKGIYGFAEYGSGIQLDKIPITLLQGKALISTEKQAVEIEIQNSISGTIKIPPTTTAFVFVNEGCQVVKIANITGKALSVSFQNLDYKTELLAGHELFLFDEKVDSSEREDFFKDPPVDRKKLEETLVNGTTIVETEVNALKQAEAVLPCCNPQSFKYSWKAKKIVDRIYKSVARQQTPASR